MARVYLGVAVLSAGVLAYEILLTRLLSIVQWHHFAFMIISLALLGFGASGTFLTFAGSRLVPRFETAFAMNAGAFAVSAYACFAIAQTLPLNLLELTWGPGQFFWLALTYVLLMLPFFFAANAIALALMGFPDAVGTTYASDLAGGALGCGAVLWLLFVTPPGGALVAVAAAGAIAAIVVAVDGGWPRAIAAVVVIAAAGAAMHTLPLELRVSEYKGLAQAARVAGARVAATRWSPLGELTVLENEDVPFRHAPGLSLTAPAPIPEQVAVFTDADAATMITRFDGDPDSVAYLDSLTSALAYHLAPVDSVLILGAGAGADVLQALHHGAGRVTAVEQDAELVSLVREDYGDFSGGIYADDRVELVIAEARDFVTTDPRRFDLIQMSALDSFGASASGLRALNESYLYTVEAMRTYSKRLAPGGYLSITRWVDIPPRDGIKLLAAAVAALEGEGVESPGARIVWVRGWASTTLIVKNDELTDTEIAALRAFASDRQFDVAYYPGMRPEEANRYNVLSTPAFHDAAIAILGPDREAFIAAYKFHVTPSTDDRPFHFRFFDWDHFPEMLALRARGGMGLLELGYIVLVAALVQAVVVSLVLILLPLLWLRRGSAGRAQWSAGALVGYFLLIGLAFLFIEIAFIQMFVRFLGHPVYSVTVVLASFLLFAALGSRLTERLRERVGAARMLVIAVSTIALVSLAYVIALPSTLDGLAGIGGLARGVVVIALIAPLAVAMGMPFPLALRSLESGAADLVPWAWAVNGCASVVSAVLAVLLAMHFGFTVVILGAAGLYVLAALIGLRGMREASVA